MAGINDIRGHFSEEQAVRGHQLSSEDDRCYLLELPPELRNHIYELVFTVPSSEEAINLATAEPPSNALVLTCRQIHHETSELYEDSCRTYWSTASFSVNGVQAGHGIRIFQLRGLLPMACIRNLHLREEKSRYLWEAKYTSGVWYTRSISPGLTTFSTYVMVAAENEAKWFDSEIFDVDLRVHVDKIRNPDGADREWAFVQFHRAQDLMDCVRARKGKCAEMAQVCARRKPLTEYELDGIRRYCFPPGI